MESTPAQKRFDRIFGERPADYKIGMDIAGGVVTFLAMCYILPVNAAILSDTGMDTLGVFASTALISGIATILMGLLGKAPVALSAGMGLNAFLTYTICGILGFSWQEGMIILTVSGLLYLLLSVTKVRLYIVKAFPSDVKKGISAALGAFLAFIGLKGAGIIVSDSSTLVALGSISTPSVLLSIVGILFVFFLSNVKTKSGLLSYLALPLSMVVIALIGYFMRLGGVADSGLPNVDFTTHWGINNYEKVFFYGAFDAGAANQDFGEMLLSVFSNPLSYAAIVSLILVNLFDTTATLLACAKEANLLDEEGNLKSNGPVLADAIGAVICAPAGTSTVTSFAESAVGIKTGARTGFASLITGILFILSAFLYPLFELFSSSCVSAAALVSVGSLVFASNLKDVEWAKPESAAGVFMTILMVVLSYSLTTGIAFGLLSYLAVSLARGKFKENGWMMYVVAGLLAASLIITEVIKA